MRGIIVGILLVVAAASVHANPVDLDDEFDKGLPPHWDTCQMYAPKRDALTPVDPDDPTDKIARIMVDRTTLGGRKCFDPDLKFMLEAVALAEEVEALGPNLVGSYRPVPKARMKDPNEVDWKAEANIANPYCTSDVLKRTRKKEGACIQREEMRLKTKFTGDPRETRYFSIRFRVPKPPEDTLNSIRWILAQWKMEPTENTDPSPYLALRFNRGILHLTVQNEEHRCLMASAKLPGGKYYPWKNGEAKYCTRAIPCPENGKNCDRSGIFAHYHENPHLDSPIGQFVEFQLAVQAGPAATIEVRQNGRPIVTMTGNIGYKLDERPGKDEPSLKFKTGHYRDYIRSNDALEIDWIRISGAKPWQ